MARMTRMKASQRAKKGWETRRRTNPSQYGNVRHERGKTYWERPNGQKVRLKGFNPTEVEKLKPAFIATDVHLKRHVRPDLGTIKKGHSYMGNIAEYRVPMVRSPHIVVTDKTFKRSFNPSGIVQHELGHSIYPGTGASKNRNAQFRKDFRYKKGKGHDANVSKYSRAAGNTLPRKKRTRQAHDAAEDFAETYRSLTGLKVNNRSYWSPKVDAARANHLYTHYLR